MALGLGALAAGVGLAGTLFGGQKGNAPSHSSSSASGYAALPPEVQKLWLDYAKQLEQYQGGNNQGLRTEPLNPYQQQALEAYGNPDYSQQGLAPYTQPYQHILDRINERYDTELAQQRGNFAANNSGKGFYNSGAQRNANMLNESRKRSLAEAEADITNQALNLRNQTLGQQFNAGATLRGYNQENLPYELNNRYAGLLNQFPQSQTTQSSQSGDTRRPNRLSQLGSLGLAVAGGQFGQEGGFGQKGSGLLGQLSPGYGVDQVPLGGLSYTYQQPRNQYENMAYHLVL